MTDLPRWVDGEVLGSTKLNTLASSIEQAVDNIDGSRISGDIDSKQITDRFTIYSAPILLVPYAQTATWSGGAVRASLPAAMTRIMRFNPLSRSGHPMYLCSIHVAWESAVSSSGAWPSLEVYRDTGILATGVNLDNTGPAERRLQVSPDPILNPLTVWPEDDFMEFRLGSSTGANNPTIAGLVVTPTFKIELSK